MAASKMVLSSLLLVVMTIGISQAALPVHGHIGVSTGKDWEEWAAQHLGGLGPGEDGEEGSWRGQNSFEKRGVVVAGVGRVSCEEHWFLYRGDKRAIGVFSIFKVVNCFESMLFTTIPMQIKI